MKKKTATPEEINEFLRSKTSQHDKCRYVDTLKIVKLREGVPEIPRYATPGSAGLDLRADLSYIGLEHFLIPPNSRELASTGYAVEIPRGFEGQIRSRSGLALNHGIIVLNSPGTIDSDYRGEILVILYNTTEEYFKVHHGDRIAQLVISPVVQLPLQVANSLSKTSRGIGGFGHTGIK